MIGHVAIAIHVRGSIYYDKINLMDFALKYQRFHLALAFYMHISLCGTQLVKMTFRSLMSSYANQRF